ncbi:MAG: ATP synthase F1 subunit delta [Muribaculaceae bacterium]|nr:ATP synthase F1 subunit delta [Muribaculaceae bacterium]
MSDGLIPRRYAKALYKLAVENGDATEIYEQLKQLDFRYAAIDELKRAVLNPYIPDEDKGRALLEAAGARPGSSLDKFLLLVIRNNRATFLRKIALAYVAIYRAEHNIAKVEIATASELPQEEVNSILEVVKKRLGNMTLEVERSIDPSLIGGFTVKVDDILLDASIKNELKTLRLKLQK